MPRLPHHLRSEHAARTRHDYAIHNSTRAALSSPVNHPRGSRTRPNPHTNNPHTHPKKAAPPTALDEGHTMSEP
eukprot:3434074-Prymnesium_polylepis.1